MSIEERAPPRPATSFFGDVGEKKLNLRRIASEVGTMAAELHRVRSLVAAQEAALLQEAGKRQIAEATARDMMKQLEKMHSSLEDSNLERQNSASVAKQSLTELMEVTERLAEAEEITEATSSFSSLLRVQCETLLRELEQKKSELQQQKIQCENIELKYAELQSELKQKETTQKELRHKVCDLEAWIDLTTGGPLPNKESKFQKLLTDVSARNIEHLEKHLLAKDDEIARLKQEVALVHAEAKLKCSEFAAKVEKQHNVEQELQQKIMKLEFCLDEARQQIRKLKKIAEEQETQSCAQVWLHETTTAQSQPNFWANFKFPCLLSMSAIAVVCIIKR